MRSIRVNLPVLATLLAGHAALAAKIPHETYSAMESEAPPVLTLEEPAPAAKPVAEETTPAAPAPAPKKAVHKTRKKVVQKEKGVLTKRVEALETEMKEVREKMTDATPPPAAEPAVPEEAKEKVPAYDLVPGDQKDSIVKRLQLTEELVRKYGRAYDYRVYTTQALKQILSDLEKAPATGPLPAPKETDPKEFDEESKRGPLHPAVTTL